MMKKTKDEKIVAQEVLKDILKYLKIEYKLIPIHRWKCDKTVEFKLFDTLNRYRSVWFDIDNPTDNFFETIHDKIYFEDWDGTETEENMLSYLMTYLKENGYTRICAQTTSGVNEVIFNIPKFESIYDLKIKTDMMI